MFSKSCEYAIRAALFIAQQSQSGNRVGLKQIAAATDSPVAFTAKILQQLAKSDVIDSIRGPKGGFEMNTQQFNEVMLSQVVKAIDGDQVYRGCGLGLRSCNEAMPCPVHEQFKRIRDELQHMLETTKLQQLANGLSEGVTFLKG